jgi:hypothetical protein
MRILFFLLLATNAFAETEVSKFRISPLALERRFEATTDPILTGHSPLHFSLGMIFRKHFVSLEYSTFKEKTGNNTFAVERDFHDLLAWYRYSLKDNSRYRYNIGLGLGMYQEVIVTRFYESKEESFSGPKVTYGAVAGVEYDLSRKFVIALDGRLLAGENLDPNPQPAILTRIYFQF